MHRHLPLGYLLVALSLATTLGHAQAPDDSIPASTNVGGAQYPRVTANGRVIFRVKAPDAQKVQIEPLNAPNPSGGQGYNGLGKAPFDMTKDADGYWTVTTPPAVPGLHYYYVLIDGAEFDDPGSETFFANNRESSAVEVPEPGVDFYKPKDVQHGQMRIFWYYSKITSQWRRVFVYTPPGYDTHPVERYPVLYLRHGGSESETAWINQGQMNFIMDNLLATGKARPMLVVMENSYAYPKMQEPNAFYAHSSGTSPEAQKARAETQKAFQDAQQAFADVTIKETIPAVEASFRTIPDHDHRAVAGFSMGSGQALTIGLENLDKFTAIGVFSRPPMGSIDPRTSYGGVMADSAAFNQKLHLFWWSAGTAETGIYNGVKAVREAFDKAGIKYSYVEYAGLSHEWQVWRKQLNDFAPLLFRW